MIRYAMIENDIVVNIAVWDAETDWQPELEILELEEDSVIQIGWIRSGNEWTAPDPEEV